MSSAFRFPFAPWAALTLALCAGCEGPPRGTSAAKGSGASAGAEQRFAFDRQAPGSENRVPVLSGIGGKLGYRPGCLFLVDEQGGETGLVVPSHVTFDGQRMMGKLKTPDGKPMGVAVGEFVNLTGRMIENPLDGRYSCETDHVLIADYF